MRMAEVIPLYKGWDQDQVINYRPIFLPMTISRKDSVQQGIQLPGKEPVTLWKPVWVLKLPFLWTGLVGRIMQAKEQGKHSAAVLLDLSKAFNTLNHGVLLKKLERYWIWGTTLEWFTSYLQGRSLRAKVSTGSNSITYSKQYDITYRTSQTNCLGPLLFILFCNDIYKLPIFGSLILFADNTTHLNHHQNRKFLEITTWTSLIIGSRQINYHWTCPRQY